VASIMRRSSSSPGKEPIEGFGVRWPNSQRARKRRRNQRADKKLKRLTPPRRLNQGRLPLGWCGLIVYLPEFFVKPTQEVSLFHPVLTSISPATLIRTVSCYSRPSLGFETTRAISPGVSQGGDLWRRYYTHSVNRKNQLSLGGLMGGSAGP
jgi:hypothetical protein